jgi:hypothetical protein
MKSVNRRHRFMIRIRRLRARVFAKTCHPAPFMFTMECWQSIEEDQVFDVHIPASERLVIKRLASESRCCDRQRA